MGSSIWRDFLFSSEFDFFISLMLVLLIILLTLCIILQCYYIYKKREATKYLKSIGGYLETISSNSEFHISAYPNAGLPNAFGQYDETPEQMATQIKEYVEKNLINIIGGCCGTTPEHIKAIADLVKD